MDLCEKKVTRSTVNLLIIPTAYMQASNYAEGNVTTCHFLDVFMMKSVCCTGDSHVELALDFNLLSGPSAFINHSTITREV